MRATKLFVLLCPAVLALGVPPLTMAAEDGAKIVEEVCFGCHKPKMRPIEKMHFTREEWAAAIERMIDMGAEVPKNKVPELLDYLVRTQGPLGDAAAGPLKGESK